MFGEAKDASKSVTTPSVRMRTRTRILFGTCLFIAILATGCDDRVNQSERGGVHDLSIDGEVLSTQKRDDGLDDGLVEGLHQRSGLPQGCYVDPTKPLSVHSSRVDRGRPDGICRGHDENLTEFRFRQKGHTPEEDECRLHDQRVNPWPLPERIEPTRSVPRTRYEPGLTGKRDTSLRNRLAYAWVGEHTGSHVPVVSRGPADCDPSGASRQLLFEARLWKDTDKRLAEEASTNNKFSKDESSTPTKETVRKAVTHFSIHIVDSNQLEAAKVMSSFVLPAQHKKEDDVEIPTLEQSLALMGRNYLFTIENTGNEPITLNFSSGQAFDATLSGENGIVWRWSADKMFTMALWDTVVKPGGVLESEFELPPLPVGTYVLKAWSVAREARAIPPAVMEITSDPASGKTTARPPM